MFRFSVDIYGRIARRYIDSRRAVEETMRLITETYVRRIEQIQKEEV